MTSTGDHVLRAMTNDGAFRVIAARTTDLVNGAALAQNARGSTLTSFAELLTGATVFREVMSPHQRVQLIVSGAKGVGALVADSLPDGLARGLVTLGSGGADVALGEGARLRMVRGLGSGQYHEGVVALDQRISDGLTTYLSNAQKSAITIGLAAIVKDGRVELAGGYAVQALPEASRGLLMIMTERLEQLTDTRELMSRTAGEPSKVVDEILFGMAFTELESRPVAFGCICDEARVMAALATLGRAEIEDAIGAGKMLEMSCDYCGREYRIQPERLRALLDPS
ncbi:MAG: Hsp33 family molecular chaperone HslO [Deltaproteobacteria bacterium]|nr:Hsp33 family molecular chaperone HslO [Deltaproteobacteria bacterium]